MTFLYPDSARSNGVTRPPRRTAGLSLCGLISLLLCGCSPPPPTTAEVEMSVGQPGADPGQLTADPIDPPDLNEIDGTAARPIAMKVDANETTARQRNAEEVPKPSPDQEATAEEVPAPAGKEDLTDENLPLDLRPADYRQWEPPRVTLVITGQQHGYIEPCGCTGLDRQKGGMARRFTFIKQLRDMNWTIVPIDAGNQVRRFGRQAEVKFQQTAKALQAMDYQAVGFGPDDLRLGVGELLAVAAAEDPEEALYVSGNVALIDESLMPRTKVVERNGLRIGVTSITDPESFDVPTSDEIIVDAPVEAARKAAEELQQKRATFRVLMYFGEEEAAKRVIQQVPEFELLIVAGGYGEPLYKPEIIEDTQTRMIVTGAKGMYAGILGIYLGGEIKYARVPLTHEFKDAPEMRQLMKEYQDQLRDIGLKGLGLLPPIPHSSGEKFVGTAKCGECHTTAFDIWEGTMHALATEHIIEPPKERGDIARHFDPECLSCHVTGWNPQEYYPYQSGYLSLEQGSHLTGNGCENCHGPGSGHVAAEEDPSVSDDERTRLRDAMKLPLEDARERCMACHDLDNSPDFHEEDAFEDIYWPEVEHYGVD